MVKHSSSAICGRIASHKSASFNRQVALWAPVNVPQGPWNAAWADFTAKSISAGVATSICPRNWDVLVDFTEMVDPELFLVIDETNEPFI